MALEPDVPFIANDFAFFLIDNEINIEEGLELVEKALKVYPNSFLYHDTKAWGLFKLGKYDEAYEILSRIWEARPYFNYNILKHLREAEKAVSEQNN